VSTGVSTAFLRFRKSLFLQNLNFQSIGFLKPEVAGSNPAGRIYQSAGEIPPSTGPGAKFGFVWLCFCQSTKL
jgi:hypothetical protein